MTEVVDFSIVLTWQFYLVAACCGALGEVVKRIPHVPAWLIPVTNTLFGVIFMMALLGANALNILAGILAASVATFVYEIFKGIVEGPRNLLEITSRKRLKMGMPNSEQVAAMEGFSEAEFARTECEQGTCEPNWIVLHDGCQPMSCHYDVEGGTVIEETDAAWHVGNWNKSRRSLSFNLGTKEMTPEEEDALVEAICQAMKKYDISLERVVRHFDLTGAQCPATYVDDRVWDRLKGKIEKKLN